MRSKMLALALTVTALVGSGLVNAPAAVADVQIELTYSAPELTGEGDKVTWHWDLANKGDENAEQVVLTHTLTPNMSVSEMPAQCTPAGETIRCDYDGVRAGETLQGTLVADVPPGYSGSVNISGKVTWATEPGPPLDPAASEPSPS